MRYDDAVGRPRQCRHQPAEERRYRGRPRTLRADECRGELPRHSTFRITIADAGQADVNSTDACTPGGTSRRSTRSKPNFGK